MHRNSTHRKLISISIITPLTSWRLNRTRIASQSALSHRTFCSTLDGHIYADIGELTDGVDALVGDVDRHGKKEKESVKGVSLLTDIRVTDIDHELDGRGAVLHNDPGAGGRGGDKANFVLVRWSDLPVPLAATLPVRGHVRAGNSALPQLSPHSRSRSYESV